MAVEFRDRSWLTVGELPRTIETLNRAGIVLIACDDLAHEVYGLEISAGRLPIVLEVTAPKIGVYIRLHRCGMWCALGEEVAEISNPLPHLSADVYN
mmetsp:Transcript_3278/g.9349  ORF Transcript_3278/g.9349 Transcript_3278/m.9349 type:complete len:97 (+) Transcript_3278:568-858(+)